MSLLSSHFLGFSFFSFPADGDVYKGVKVLGHSRSQGFVRRFNFDLIWSEPFPSPSAHPNPSNTGSRLSLISWLVQSSISRQLRRCLGLLQFGTSYHQDWPTNSLGFLWSLLICPMSLVPPPV